MKNLHKQLEKKWPFTRAQGKGHAVYVLLDYIALTILLESINKNNSVWLFCKQRLFWGTFLQCVSTGENDKPSCNFWNYKQINMFLFIATEKLKA